MEGHPKIEVPLSLLAFWAFWLTGKFITVSSSAGGMMEDFALIAGSQVLGFLNDADFVDRPIGPSLFILEVN
jgi:hypothetical protein